MKRLLLIGIHYKEYPRNITLYDSLKTMFNVKEVLLERESNQYIKFAIEMYRWGKSGNSVLITTPPEKFFFHLLLFRILFPKTRVIVDMFTPEYEIYVYDKKVVHWYSIKGLYHWVSGAIVMRVATVLLFDTEEHKRCIEKIFKLPANKRASFIIPVSVDVEYLDRIKPETLENVGSVKKKRIFLFYGNYTPLQGVKFIVQAISLLHSTENMLFIFVGSGHAEKETVSLIQKLGLRNILIKPRMPYDKLVALMKAVDVVFGIFGDSQKALLVVPNKVVEGLACGKVVITGRSKAIEEYFEDRESIIFTEMADSESIAAAIQYVDANYNELSVHISRKARSVIDSSFSKESLLKTLEKLPV